MKQYMIVNDNEPNDSFYVEADSEEEAKEKALEELGYWVAEGEAVEDES